MELVVELIDAKAQGISFDGPPKRHEEFTNRIRGMFGYDGPAIRLEEKQPFVGQLQAGFADRISTDAETLDELSLAKWLPSLKTAGDNYLPQLLIDLQTERADQAAAIHTLQPCNSPRTTHAETNEQA